MTSQKDYRRRQRAYLALREQMDKDSSKEDANTDEKDIAANFACRDCEEAFPSNNQLHSHLKSFNAHAVEGTPSVIDLTAKPKGRQPECVASCTETCVKACPSIDSDAPQPFTAVIDSGFGRSAVNRKLLDSVPHTTKAIKQLVIRGIWREKEGIRASEVHFLSSKQSRSLLETRD